MSKQSEGKRISGHVFGMLAGVSPKNGGELSGRLKIMIVVVISSFSNQTAEVKKNIPEIWSQLLDSSSDTLTGTSILLDKVRLPQLYNNRLICRKQIARTVLKMLLGVVLSSSIQIHLLKFPDIVAKTRQGLRHENKIWKQTRLNTKFRIFCQFHSVHDSRRPFRWRIFEPVSLCVDGKLVIFQHFSTPHEGLVTLSTSAHEVPE